MIQQNLFARNNKDHTASNMTKFTRKTKFVRDLEDKVFIK